MTKIEKEYKKRFNNQELSNDDFDTDGLWNEISGELDESTSAKFKRKNLLWFMFLFFGVSLLTLLYLNTEYKKESQEISDLHELENEVNKGNNERIKSIQSPERGNDEIDENLKIENYLDPEKILDKKILDELSSTKNIDPNTPSQIEEKPIVAASRNTIFENENENESGNSEKNETKEASIDQLDPLVKSNKILNTPSQKPFASQIFEEVDLLPLKLNLLAVDYPDLPDHRLSKNINNEGRNNNSILWKVDIWGGINTTKFSYKSENNSDLALLKEQTEKGLLGISFGVNTAMVMKNNWLLRSGFEYHQLETKFKYTEQSNIDVLKENQLLRVWVDAISGDTLNKSFGDTLVNTTSTRRVVHYNRYRKISIPIEIGLQQLGGKLMYGGTAGLVFNFNPFQKGKTLNKDSGIIAFDQNSTSSLFQNFDIGLRLSPFVGYQIQENLFAVLRPQWNLHFNADFDDTDIKMNAHQFNVNLGVEYFFNKN